MKFSSYSGQRTQLVLNVIVFTLSLYQIANREPTVAQYSPFEAFLMDSFAPFQRVITLSKIRVNSFFANYLMNLDASLENKILKSKLEELEQRNFLREQVDKENERLKKILNFVENRTEDRVLAKVVAFDASSDHKVIRINRGKDQGVRLRSPVITYDGLVGYVFRLSHNFADVLTILDPNNRVDGIVDRIRSHGIVEGFIRGRCRMKYVSRAELIVLNDLVISSGLGNIYPKGIKIGTISRIEREVYGVTQELEITPAVNFGQLEEVLVLVSANQAAEADEWEKLDNQNVP